MKRINAVALLLAVPMFAGCYSDDSTNPPPAPPVPSGGAVFQRFVSMGNSISAGFQSGGINDSTQQRSFPVLVAAAAGADFTIPHLVMPGCPSPYVNNAQKTHVGGIPDATYRSICFGRVSNTGDINNVAVPGAGIRDMFSNFATPVGIYEQLSAFFLGGRTEIQAMQQKRPTLISLEIGPNDVLGALLATNPGDPAEITPLASFQDSLTKLLDSLDATGADVAIFTVPDVTVIPYASAGSTYWCLRTGLCPGIPQQLPPGLTVNNNCAPAAAVPNAKGDSTLVPWVVGLPRVFAAAQGAPGQVIDCSVDADVVLPAEFAQMRTAVVGFNTAIATEATARGYAVVDMNAILIAARLAGAIPPFPNTSAVSTGGSITFGPFISLDGFHPTTAAHRVLADSLASALNAKYGTTLPVPICGAITCPN